MSSADHYFSVAEEHLKKSRLIDAKNTANYALRLNPHHGEALALLRRIHDGINEVRAPPAPPSSAPQSLPTQPPPPPSALVKAACTGDNKPDPNKQTKPS